MRTPQDSCQCFASMRGRLRRVTSYTVIFKVQESDGLRWGFRLERPLCHVLNRTRFFRGEYPPFQLCQRDLLIPK